MTATAKIHIPSDLSGMPDKELRKLELQIARKHNPVELRESTGPEESARIWLGRKSAFGAMGQINDYMCLDGTIPVNELP